MPTLPSDPQIGAKTEFSHFVQDSRQLVDRCLDLLASKNHDYAENKDAFMNFKIAAQIAGIPPEQTLLTLLGMKMSRLSQLLTKDKQPKHEAIDDTLMDVINYSLLLRGIIQERSPASAPSSHEGRETLQPAHIKPADAPNFASPNLLANNSF